MIHSLCLCFSYFDVTSDLGCCDDDDDEEDVEEAEPSEDEDVDEGDLGEPFFGGAPCAGKPKDEDAEIQRRLLAVEDRDPAARVERLMRRPASIE